MAAGTPVALAGISRNTSTSDITSSTFTSVAGETIMAAVMVSGGGSAVPDGLTGHDGDNTWVQVGSTSQAPGSRFSMSFWACHSSGTSSTAVAVQNSTSVAMAAMIITGVTGLDVSGTVANSFTDAEDGSGYGTSMSPTTGLTGSDLTIGFWGAQDTPTLTPEGTALTTAFTWLYNSKRSTSDYDATGDSTPTCAVSSSKDWACFAVEVKEAGASVTAALTGTATASITETDLVDGGKTVIVTLVGDTFKAAGTGPIGSTADTQALIDGFDAASSPTNGWNNEVRDKAVPTEVVRTSSTVATWTILAQAGYDISAQETITGTIPTAVLVTGAGALTATPTFTVDTAVSGRIMGSLAGQGGLAGVGGLAGRKGGMAG